MEIIYINIIISIIIGILAGGNIFYYREYKKVREKLQAYENALNIFDNIGRNSEFDRKKGDYDANIMLCAASGKRETGAALSR